MPDINIFSSDMVGALWPIMKWLIVIVIVTIVLAVLTRKLNKELTSIIFAVTFGVSAYLVFTL